MRLLKDELNLKVVVRRVATGAAPYGWELHSGDVITPIHLSRARFRSMEAAFKAGQAGSGRACCRAPVRAPGSAAASRDSRYPAALGRT